MLEEESLYLSLLYIHDLFFSQSTTGIIPSLLSTLIKLFLVIYISCNCFLNFMLGSYHRQLSEGKLIFQQLLKLDVVSRSAAVCIRPHLSFLCPFWCPNTRKTSTNSTKPRKLSNFRVLHGVWSGNVLLCPA